MIRETTELKFYFGNGGTWTVDYRFVGNLWIKYITTSFDRIHGSGFVEIHPCEGFKIEIFQEGDHVQTHNINSGSLELGMFSRALEYEDIERMEILYKNGAPGLVYFPYRDKADEGLNNIHQSTKASGKAKNLYIVIDPT